MFPVDLYFLLCFEYTPMFFDSLISLPSWTNRATKKWLIGFVRLDLDKVDAGYHRTSRHGFVSTTELYDSALTADAISIDDDARLDFQPENTK